MASLAQDVVELVSRDGWKVEGMFSERGELDEVFRRITLPDTVKNDESHPDHRQARAGRLLRLAGGLHVPGDLPAAHRLLHFTAGNFFERGEASLAAFFGWHPWLYLVLVPAVGMRVWAEERRSGTLELLLTMPVAPWQAIVAKFLASWVFLLLALALTFPAIVTVNVLGDPDNGIIAAGYVGSFSPRRRLPRDQLHDLGDDAQPGGRVHPLGRAVPVPGARRLQPGDRPADALGKSRAGRHRGGVLGGDALRRLPARRDRLRDLVYFLSVIGFALFATGVIIRGHR